MESCDMEIQNYLQREREAVIEPCKTRVRSLFTHALVTDVSEFGSRECKGSQLELSLGFVLQPLPPVRF